MNRSSFLASAEFDATRRRAIDSLLATRNASGHWTGKLSSSALATATAMTALRLVDHRANADAIGRGAEWLVASQLPDGSWGDTPVSLGNLSTTLLCWATLGAVADDCITATTARENLRAAIARAATWIVPRTGGLDAARIADALGAIYGKDKTFSVPILTLIALCGRFGDLCAPATWRVVPQLPFELAALPPSWFRLVDMQVVSYALPALIAIGQVRHALAPGIGPASWVRHATVEMTLRRLEAIQPTNGGFLEATPLTSFVTMSLAGMGRGDHVVARRGTAFLVASQRADGSWPIDTNLSTWGTTLAVNALAAGGRLADCLDGPSRESIRQWLLGQQYRHVHPATGAAPGGWAWTDLPGGVPDADDTSGAIVALANLERAESRPVQADVQTAATRGMKWLSKLANRDGGIPTFCRGWGRLPFDTSCPDITAHFLRAIAGWSQVSSAGFDTARPAARARRYLAATQRADGSWTPLWFGNEHHAAEENPVYGTAKVVLATGDERGAAWLIDAIGADGGVGGGRGLPPSIEETAVTIEALASFVASRPSEVMSDPPVDPATAAVNSSAAWLAAITDGCRTFPTAPIGLYFAKLWYSEELYPRVFAVAALERASRLACR